MRDIVYGPEGPEGFETIEFAPLGIRFAVLEPNGKLVRGDDYAPTMLGGQVPIPGDRFSMLWPRDDPGDNQVFEVVSRHYVGEFDGDYCWWVIVRAAPPSKLDLQLYKLAKTASSRSRKNRAAREKAALTIVGKKPQKGRVP